MAEAVFASENIKGFALQDTGAILAAGLAVLPQFPKDFFVGNRPRDAGHGNGEQKQKQQLLRNGHLWVYQQIPCQRSEEL